MTKTRAQDRAASVEPGASQSSNNKQTQRYTRKRRASSVSQAESDVVDTSQLDSSQTTNKKRRRTKVTINDVPESNELPEHPQLEPIVEESQTSQITTKSAASRRATLPAFTQDEPPTTSPAQLRVKPRKSLPASLAQLSSPTHSASGLLSLKAVIQQRMKHRLGSLPMAQLDGSDDNDISLPDRDIMVYSNIDGPSQVPEIDVQSPISERADSLTEVSSTTVIKSDQERINYEASINRLTQEVSEAKSTLEILTVELSSMGFGNLGDNAQAVINSIRGSFNHVRHRLRDVMPFDVAGDVTEQTLLIRLADQMVMLANDNAKKEVIVAELKTFEQELLEQIDALIDKLTEANIIRERLENANRDFDTQNEEDDRYIKKLEKKMKDIEIAFQQVSTTLQDKVNRIKTLETESLQRDDDFAKLQSALQSYRQREAELENLITRLEQDHAGAVQVLMDRHNVEQQTLKTRLLDEQETRQVAETRSADVERVAEELRKSLEKEAAMISKLKADIEELRADMREAQSGKDSAEDDAATKALIIIELETTLEQVETTLAETEKEYVELQRLSEAERRQREAAETELDSTLVKLKSLQDKLHNQGIEANELRQKLFEVQQRDQKIIEQYKTQVAERTEIYESDLAAETARREDAESNAAERQATIDELEDRISGIETDMQKALDAKEELLQTLDERYERQGADLDEAQAALDTMTAKYKALQQSTDIQIVTLEQAVSELTTTLNKETAELSRVRDQATTQQSLMLSALTDRDNTINTLTTDLDTANKAIIVLEGDKASLERRVENEAEAMLTYTAEKEDQVAALQDVVREKQATIDDLKAHAVEVDRVSNQLIMSKDTQIETLRVDIETRDDGLAGLKERNRELRMHLEAYVAMATLKIGTLSAEVERLGRMGREHEGELRREGKRLLEDAMEMVGVVEEQQGAGGTAPGKAVEQTKKKVKRTRKAVKDSGFGGSSDVEGMLA